MNLGEMKAKIMHRITRERIDIVVHTAIFCFIRVPVALAAVFVLMIALAMGDGNPAYGVARSVVALMGSLQPSATPGVFTEQVSSCPKQKLIRPDAHGAPAPFRPLIECHSETRLISEKELERPIATFVIHAYLAACLVGIAFAGVLGLAELLHAYRLRRAAAARYADERWEESTYDEEETPPWPTVLH